MQDPLFQLSMGQGPNIVLLHGWGLNHGIWLPLADALKQDYRVTLIDLPGFGFSHQVLPPSYNLDEVSAMVAKQLPENSIVLGWSLGGLVAQKLALMADNVAALALVASSPKFVESHNWPGIKPNVLAMFQQQLARDFAQTLDRFLAIQAMGSETPKTDLKKIKQLIQDLPLPNETALAGGLQILADADLRPHISAVKQPCLKIYGRLDSLVPAKAHGLISGLQPNAEQVVLNKASHGPFISHPQEFLDCLTQWLQKLVF